MWQTSDIFQGLLLWHDHTSGIDKSYQGILGICYFLLAGSNCHTVFCWLPDDQGRSELYYKIKREHKI